MQSPHRAFCVQAHITLHLHLPDSRYSLLHGTMGLRRCLATGWLCARGRNLHSNAAMGSGAPCCRNTFRSAGAGVHPERLYRILRFAVNHHCLAVVRSISGGPPRFRNTAMSSLLREDHPNSLKAIVCPSTAMLCAQANVELLKP